MGNWIPDDPTLVARMLEISASYSPPPPAGFVSPMRWGIESDVIERFSAASVRRESVSFARSTFTFDFPGSPAAFVAAFRRDYGPTMTAFEAAARTGREVALQADLEALVVAQNRARGENLTSIPATYLRVTVSL